MNRLTTPIRLLALVALTGLIAGCIADEETPRSREDATPGVEPDETIDEREPILDDNERTRNNRTTAEEDTARDGGGIN